jgi:hypothetical protein
MYESLLFFQRLTANVVEKYDFANGAPAVGAWLDLRHAPQIFQRIYAGKPLRKNLHAYFIEHELPNIDWPQRRYYTTNDPVLTPDLLDHFFNVRTQGFATLDDHRKELLHSIYDLPEYDAVLPPLPYRTDVRRYREHSRYSCKCPGYLTIANNGWKGRFEIDVVDVSRYGFLARCREALPLKIWSDATLKLGPHDVATIKAIAVREHPLESTEVHAYGFNLGDPDVIWNTFIETLTAGMTYGDVTPAG